MNHISAATQSCLTLCDLMDCSMPGFPVHHQPLVFKLMSIESVMPFNHLSAPSPPAFNLSQHQGLFQWLSSSHQVAKVLRVQIQLSSSNEYSGLISFSTDWFNLLAVQGILKGLLHRHSSKSINSLALSFLYGPTLTSIYDYWKNHSFD